MKFISYRSQPVLWSSLDRRPSLRGWLDSAFVSEGLSAVGARRCGGPASLDIYEAAEAVIVRVEAAGFKKEDFEVSLQDDNLTVSGERRAGDEGSPHPVARFSRTVTLPRAVAPEAVTASYENGVLTVTLPKAEEARPRRIEVNAK